MSWSVYIIIGVILLSGIISIYRHQRSLKQRAYLMREAIQNRDFTFRLSTKGLMIGERAMQEVLNQLGDTIRQQINQNEVESWERLTRVLTHEIMNATAPITSISQSLLNRGDVKDSPLEEGIRAIFTTSKHLNAFVDSYRKMSELQEPAMEAFPLTTITNDICLLYPTVNWDISVSEDTIVYADQNMLRQILMNLGKNAVEAGAHRIGLEYAKNFQTLYVSNDGQPIPAEVRKSIFIPFFTTKHSGNGIGLPLSRRMMIQQDGNLSLIDHPLNGYHTTFAIEFQHSEATEEKHY
ncbi:MAG: HAMP domain-containing histidine kinase [Prevotella sp.]|nr:HAMP domain-containing histidine kinase [Prevotella sp.]